MKICKACGFEAEDDDIKCPACDARLPSRTPFIVWFLLGLFLLFIWMSFQVPEPEEGLTQVSTHQSVGPDTLPK